jgi:hypothetical protein
MDALVHELRIVAGGILCGAAFTVILLVVAGAL